MRITKSFFLSLIFILLTGTYSFALGKAASMGNLQSIVPSGPFDAARNPALLPLQSSDNSTGIFYTYIMHFAQENSAYYDQHKNQTSPPNFNADINSNISIDDPKINGMSCQIANIAKSSKFVFGLALTDSGNDQYLVTKEKTINEFIGIDTTNNSAIIRRSKETTKTTEINPALISSIGFNLSNTSSIGFQLFIGYSNKLEEKNSYVEDYFGTNIPLGIIPIFTEKSEKNILKISGELGLGYLYNKDNQQIGIFFKTGELSYIEKKLKVRTDYIDPPNSPQAADSSLRMKGKYTSGPGIIAGAYKRLNSYFALALETGIDFENSYQDEDLDLKKNSTEYKIVVQNSTTTIYNIYSFRTGFEINLFKNFILAFGSSYLTGSFGNCQVKRTSDFQRRFDAEMDIHYWMSTLGMHYAFSKNVTLDFITAFIVYKKILQINVREESLTSTDESDIHGEQKNKGMFIKSGLGVTFSF